MTFLPSVIRAEYRGGYRIHLTFNDNSEKTVDFGPWLAGPVFEPLKDLNYFRRFFLDGGTVVWPNGADIAPETLYEHHGSGRPRGRRSHPAAANTSRPAKRMRQGRRG
ncbi:MAG: DUF2442 domain-containing protein [Acidobacteria bacterium]|nr:DUF2442 domain-containing protein [Acidobacteriota bacterium]